MQSPPEANCIEQIQHASQYKVRNLNPSPVTKRENAQHIDPQVKTRASVVLNEQGQDKEWTSDGSAEQQYPGERQCLRLHTSSYVVRYVAYLLRSCTSMRLARITYHAK